MLIPLIVPLWSAAMLALYRHFARKQDARALWRSSVVIGSSLGSLRAVLACVGWYGVEHTDGPLQVPAFALAMLAWPEGALVGPHRGPTPVSFYPILGGLLLMTSLLLVSAVALGLQVTRDRRDV